MKHRWVTMLLPLLSALALKIFILVTGSVTFDSDEAILALMARHILAGEHPLFFYGQHYMGALDAYLIAGAFLLFGQHVIAVRLVQVALTFGVVGTSWLLAEELGGQHSRDNFAGLATGLLIAWPPILFALYTTATLGNYVETLLLNNLLWLIAIKVAKRSAECTSLLDTVWLFVWGVLAGLGWWGMVLILTAALPTGLALLWDGRRRLPQVLPPMITGFVLGAAPWLWGTLMEGATTTVGDLAGVWINEPFRGNVYLGRLMMLVVFNLPALFGLRPPWSTDWVMLPVGLLVVGIYLTTLWDALHRTLSRAEPTPTRSQIALLLGGWAFVLAGFLLTPFGRDPTGRYLLTLYPPLAILVGAFLARLPRRALGWGILATLLAYNLYGVGRSIAQNPPGLTTQFDLISHIPHDHDDELIAFLDSIGASRGYSNYWVTYRFAFLTGERIIFVPRLPYKANMSYTYDDNRYPPYAQTVAAAREVVYVTNNHPELDAEISQRFNALGISFREQQIGPYHVFYDLPRHVTPEELGSFGEVSGGP